MSGRCDRHSFDHAVGTCQSCRGSFCENCLVYTFGPKRPPYCIPCALVAGGVRSSRKRTSGLVF